MKSIAMPTEPTVRQVDAILARIEQELVARGARVARPRAGTLHFEMPLPWRAHSLGLLAAITSGRAQVSAGAGGPRRVR